MRDRLVYICSPCRGDMEKNIIKAQGYCREAAELWPDVLPIAPHVYCTQFLDDTNPQDRAVGMDMGISLLSMCDELWLPVSKKTRRGAATAGERPIQGMSHAAIFLKSRKE